MTLDSRIPLMAQGLNLEPRANALMRAQQMQAAEQQNALRAMQMQQLQQAMMQEAEQRKAQEAQRAQLAQALQSIPSPRLSPLGGSAAPTQANASKLGNDPRLEALYRLMQAGQVKPDDYLSEAYPKPKDQVLAPGATLYRGDKPVITAPSAEPKAPSAVQEYEYAKAQGYGGSFQDWTTQKARAGAASVNVNTGQKGLDNTLKLRGDFRQEPVYKAHQEMQSAYSQIKQALGKASPAGDLAGATKIMKLLDPGSVVRESELGMAMAASGLLDRLENYAQNILKGTKLTPTQRTDFQTLADALYSESVKQYNAKRLEYQGIAERNRLPVMDVLGPESTSPTTGDGWGIKPKGK